MNQNTKKLIGKVVSDKMEKTCVVAISEKRRHKMYHKTYFVTSKIKADSPNNEYKIGDMVEISETRPISSQKAWKIVRKIS